MDLDLVDLTNRIDELTKEELDKYSQKCSRNILAAAFEDAGALEGRKNEILLCQKLARRFMESVIQVEIGNQKDKKK